MTTAIDDNKKVNGFTLQERERAWTALASSIDKVHYQSFDEVEATGRLNLAFFNLKNNRDPQAPYEAGRSFLPNEPFPRDMFNGNINLEGNQLTHLDFLSPLRMIKNLNAQDNRIDSIGGLGQLLSCQSLHLGSNQLSDLSPLAHLVSIEQLILNNNKLTSLSGLSQLLSYELLSLSNNKLTTLKQIANVVIANNLYVRNNELTNLEGLSHLQSADYMDFTGNPLKTIDSLVNNTELDLGLLDVSDVEFPDDYDVKWVTDRRFPEGAVLYKTPSRLNYV